MTDGKFTDCHVFLGAPIKMRLPWIYRASTLTKPVAHDIVSFSLFREGEQVGTLRPRPLRESGL